MMLPLWLIAIIISSAAAVSSEGRTHCTVDSLASLHLFNPNLNALRLLACLRPLNASGQCDFNSTAVCSSFDLYPGNTTTKYYFPHRPVALAAVPWANTPFGYHALKSAPRISFFNVTSTSMTLPLLSSKSATELYCDVDEDCPSDNGVTINGACHSRVCKPIHPPSPPSPPAPLPPIAMPAASTCNLTGNWTSGSHPLGLEYAAYTFTMTSKTDFRFYCQSHHRPCIGPNSERSNGTGSLSTKDRFFTISVTGDKTYQGLVNNTYVCSAIAVLGLDYPVSIKAKVEHHPPQLNLDVASATYLGSKSHPLQITAIDTLSDHVIVVAANGYTDHLTSKPKVLLNATSASNASLILLKPIDSQLSAASGLSVVDVLKLGHRVDHLTVNDADKAIVAGSFGVAGLDLRHDGAVEWQDGLVNMMHSYNGRCVADNNASFCRTGMGDDGTSAVIIPAGVGTTQVIAYGSKGQRLGARYLREQGVTDVEVDASNRQVYVSWYYDSSTGREPMVMPAMAAYNYALGKTIYSLWPWSAHVYRRPGPCNGDVADSRAERVVATAGGELMFVGRSDGGNGAFYCQDRDSNRTTPMITLDSYTSAYNMQSQSISYLASLDPKTGQVEYGQYNLMRLPSTAGNSLRTAGLAVDGNRNRYMAQTAACCLPYMANLTVNGQALQGPSDAAVLQITNPTFSQRKVWHHFTAPTGSGKQAAVGVKVKGSLVVFALNSAGDMVQVAGVGGTGRYDNGAQQAYLVVLPAPET